MGERKESQIKALTDAQMVSGGISEETQRKIDEMKQKIGDGADG